MQNFSPLPAPVPLPPPPVVPPPRRSRRWPWMLAGGGVVVAVLAVLTVVGLVVQSSSPLVDDNLNNGAGPFVAERDAFVTLEYADGGYRMLMSADNTVPQIARTFWSPTVRSVEVAVTVSVRDTVPEHAFVGVSCFGAGASYDLWMSASGETAITRTLHNKPAEQLSAGETVSARLDTPVRLRLECWGGGNDPTKVTAYVNGQQVASADDVDSFESFGAMGVAAVADQQLDVLFDDPYAKELSAG